MFDFSWSCGSSRWTEVKRKSFFFFKKSDFWVLWDEADEPLSSNSKQHKWNRDVNSSCKYYFFLIIITSVLIFISLFLRHWVPTRGYSWQREVGPEFGQSILEFLFYFFFVFGLRETGGGGTTPIVTLHPTAVDFLKLHSVLLWVQFSAPPLAPFMQPSNQVKHL